MIASTKPWEPYAIDDVHVATKLSRLYHVAHVGDARRIIEDRRIQPDLIADESVLNKSRICVVWTSPNTWYAGSLYGNVSFTLPLSALEKRRFYWVEAMTKYSPPALRILVSSGEIASRHVSEFDPSESGVPVHRAKDGSWWRHNDYNYEVMFDEMFTLDECERIDFFDHHGRLCNKHRGGRCPEAGRRKQTAAARIAALALAVDEPDELVKLLLGPADDSDLAEGLAKISFWLSKRTYSHRAPTREERVALFAAGMHHYAYEFLDYAKAAVGGLGSADRAQRILASRTREVFGNALLAKLKSLLD